MLYDVTINYKSVFSIILSINLWSYFLSTIKKVYVRPLIKNLTKYPKFTHI